MSEVSVNAIRAINWRQGQRKKNKMEQGYANEIGEKVLHALLEQYDMDAEAANLAKAEGWQITVEMV